MAGRFGLGIAPRSASAPLCAGPATDSVLPASNHSFEMLRLFRRGFLVATSAVGVALLMSAGDAHADETTADEPTEATAETTAAAGQIPGLLGGLIPTVSEPLAPVTELLAPATDPVLSVVLPAGTQPIANVAQAADVSAESPSGAVPESAHATPSASAAASANPAGSETAATATTADTHTTSTTAGTVAKTATPLGGLLDIVSVLPAADSIGVARSDTLASALSRVLSPAAGVVGIAAPVSAVVDPLVAPVVAVVAPVTDRLTTAVPVAASVLGIVEPALSPVLQAVDPVLAPVVASNPVLADVASVVGYPRYWIQSTARQAGIIELASGAGAASAAAAPVAADSAAVAAAAPADVVVAEAATASRAAAAAATVEPADRVVALTRIPASVHGADVVAAVPTQSPDVAASSAGVSHVASNHAKRSPTATSVAVPAPSAGSTSSSASNSSVGGHHATALSHSHANTQRDYVTLADEDSKVLDGAFARSTPAPE